MRSKTREKKISLAVRSTLCFWTAFLVTCAATIPTLRAQSRPAFPKLAVLPFESSDRNATELNLGLALATEVTNWLFYVPGIVVRPLGTATNSAGTPEDLKRLVHELDVNHCLTGTIRVSASHYDVEFQLRSWPGGTEVVSESLSVSQKELPLLANRIAESVVEALPVEKGPATSFFEGKVKADPSSYFAFMKVLTSTPKTDEEKEQRLRNLGAVAVQTDYPPAIALLGHLYLDRAGEIGGRGPYYRLAEETLKRAFELDPEFPPSREYLASLFAKRGHSEQTLDLMQEGLVRHPTYPGFHKTLGYVLRYGGLMDESVAAYQRTQELDGSPATLVSIRDQITKSFIYQGDYTRALASHHDMLLILERMHREPNEKQIFYEGVIHLYAGEKRRAIECFQRSAKLEPDSVWTTFGLAYQGIAEGDRQRVADVVEQLERRNVVERGTSLSTGSLLRLSGPEGRGFESSGDFH